MTDRPILFSAPMIKALLAGRKTQTRRVLKPQPPEMPAANCHPSHTAKHPKPYLDAYCGKHKTAENPRGMSRNWHWWQVDDRPGAAVCRVPCVPGDRLWVREAHYLTDDGDNGYAVFAADESAVAEHLEEMEQLRRSHPYGDWSKHLRLRPSIHMPRWASRLTLAVTDVRAQRLWEISESDARDEGVNAPPEGYHPETAHYDSYADVFCDLWDSIHGPGAWDANPWVVAISFDVIQRNIDEAPQ